MESDHPPVRHTCSISLAPMMMMMMMMMMLRWTVNWLLNGLVPSCQEGIEGGGYEESPRAMESTWFPLGMQLGAWTALRLALNPLWGVQKV